MRSVHIRASNPYDVLIGPGLLDRAGELAAHAVAPCRCALISDSTVDALCGDRAQAALEKAGYEVVRFSFPAGEGSKHLGTLSDLLEAMAAVRLSRTDLVAALGGGVTGDMAGFAAAVGKRKSTIEEPSGTGTRYWRPFVASRRSRPSAGRGTRGWFPFAPSISGITPKISTAGWTIPPTAAVGVC